ncbi:ATP-dependent dethiobiotin synthetase BioD [Gammaproteobacteria bacterium]
MDNNRQHLGLFITATDTGVGKTAVGAVLIRHLTAWGKIVRPRKPVESGCQRLVTGLLPADAARLQQAAGRRESLERICPWPLEAPISPERAGCLAGFNLTLKDLTAACHAGVEQGDFLLVEGAGGFLSPLAPKVRNAELAVALGLPLVLVIADRLGCINHVLLTVEAIVARGLRLAAVVLNRRGATPIPGMDNAADLSTWLGIKIYCLPEISGGDQDVEHQLQFLLEPEFLLKITE